MDWMTELIRWLALAFGLVVCVIITASSYERQRQRRGDATAHRREVERASMGRAIGQRIGDWLTGCLILAEIKLRSRLCPWTDD
ncbi:hypothetical protein HYZ80_03185 [Candidatus Parcubacteria bacterium]|nr:hypothetical protein [Candidatus Parcubacteria bacterium]